MSNKTYAVVQTDTGIVFAKKFVRGYDHPPKLNNVKVGIIDYNADDALQDILAVVIANLSNTHQNVAQTKELEMDDFITEAYHPHFKQQCDYIFLSRNPAKLLEKLNVK